MKSLLFVSILAAIAVVILRSRQQTQTPADRLARLQSAINGSQLPERARDEMLALVAERRLRPSQYLDRNADVPAGDH